MEVYRVSDDSVRHFKTLFNQNGRGLDLDRYIYHQRGNGIGSFFAKLFHKVLPVAKTVLKGAANTAAPHLKALAEDYANQGFDYANNKVKNYINNTGANSNKRKRDNLDHE